MNNTTRDYSESKRTNYTAAAIGTAAGIAVGLGAGMMLAPRSGRDTRQKIKQNVREIKSNMVSKAEDVKHKIELAKEDTKRAISNNKNLQEDGSINKLNQTTKKA